MVHRFDRLHFLLLVLFSRFEFCQVFHLLLLLLRLVRHGCGNARRKSHAHRNIVATLVDVFVDHEHSGFLLIIYVDFNRKMSIINQVIQEKESTCGMKNSKCSSLKSCLLFRPLKGKRRARIHYGRHRAKRKRSLPSPIPYHCSRQLRTNMFLENIPPELHVLGRSRRLKRRTVWHLPRFGRSDEVNNANFRSEPVKMSVNILYLYE